MLHNLFTLIVIPLFTNVLSNLITSWLLASKFNDKGDKHKK